MSFGDVERIFRDQQARGAFPGGQLVVQHGDDCLIDLAIGVARGFGGATGNIVDVTSEMPFQVMSASKAVLASLIVRLEERGLIDVDAPVRRYIPEIGSSEVTILDVLIHRSGITLPEFSRHPERWGNRDAVLAALRDEPPAYRRGTLAYQPIAFGWILAEVLRRVTGETLEAFSARELDPELRWRFAGEAAETYWLGRKRFMLNGTDLASGFEETNNRVAGRTAVVPGAGMYTTARALASFYARLLRDSSPILALSTRMATRGFDTITGAYVVLGRGFALGWRWPHPYGWWNTQHCFGHPGGFSVVAYGDRETGAGVAIVTNGSRSVMDLVRRFAPLGSAIRNAMKMRLGGKPLRLCRPSGQMDRSKGRIQS